MPYDEDGKMIQEGYVLYDSERCKEQHRTTDPAERPALGPSDDDKDRLWSKTKDFLVSIMHNTLVQFGYFIKYRVMDAHLYGNIPQPRSRIYIAAFNEIRLCNLFDFPEEIKSTCTIDDIINRHEKKHDIDY